MRKSGTLSNINASEYSSLELPLPPLSEQERIVAELEGYRKVIEGARQVIANYKPTIRIDPQWPRCALSDLCSMEYGLTISGKEAGDARLVRITDITETGMLSQEEIKYVSLDNDARSYLLESGDVLVARTGATYGKTLLFNDAKPAVFASYLIRLRFTERVLPAFYWLFAQTDDYWSQARALVAGGGQPQFNGNVLRRIVMPVPPVNEQRAIVAQSDAEQALLESNRKLIEIFEAKIKAKLDEIWGEEGTGKDAPGPKADGQ